MLGLPNYSGLTRSLRPLRAPVPRGASAGVAHELGRCPGCGLRLRESDDRVRLRGDWYAHRRCATYRTRALGELGVDRSGRPLASTRAVSAAERELASRWSE